MHSFEAKEWLRTHRILSRPIVSIPIIDGFGCDSCSFVAKKTKVIWNHILKEHKDDSQRPKIVEKKIQKPFGSSIKQFVHINLLINDDESDIPDWEQNLTSQFNRMMNDLSGARSTEGLDMRLMNAFIAKIRYCIILNKTNDF